MSIPLMGFAMARFLLPSGTLLDYLVANAARGKEFQMSWQNDVNRVGGDQRHGTDLNHRAPGFCMFGFWKADCYHDNLRFVAFASIINKRDRNRNIPRTRHLLFFRTQRPISSLNCGLMMQSKWPASVISTIGQSLRIFFNGST